MRPTIIPEQLVPEDYQRLVIAAPGGDLTHPDIAPVEAILGPSGRANDARRAVSPVHHARTVFTGLHVSVLNMDQPGEQSSLPTDEGSIQICGEIVQAVGYMGQASDWLDKAREDRDKAIARLRVHGWTVRQVAEFTKLSVGWISRIDAEQGVVTTRVTRKG